MSLKSKIPLIILGLALLGLLIWSFPILKDRYFATEDPRDEEVIDSENASEATVEEGLAAEEEEPVTEDEEVVVDEEIADEEDVTLEGEEVLPDDSEADLLEEDSFLEILPSDCSNSCKEFTEPEDIEYCRQYCGLSTPRTNLTSCDQFEDLEMDYCFKDMAIAKKNSKLCDEILDANLKKACRNRIIEDVIDTQK